MVQVYGRHATRSGTVPPGGDFSTTFPATENPISEGGVWTNGSGDWNPMQTGSGNAYATATNPTQFDDNLAHLSGFAANQYIEGVVHRAGGYSPADPHEIELLLRCLATASDTRGYEILLNSDGGSDIVRWNGPRGDFTVLSWTGSGAGGVANGDVFRAEISGGVIVVKKNTVQIMTVTDSTWATGNPGIGSFMRGNGNVLASMGWQSIVAADL